MLLIGDSCPRLSSGRRSRLFLFYLCCLCCYLASTTKPSTVPLPSPPSAAPLHSSLDHPDQTRRCPPPEFPPPPAPHRPLCGARRRHPLRCDKSDGVGCESPPTAAFCAA